jgi:hypothetical protein
VGGFYETVT